MIRNALTFSHVRRVVQRLYFALFQLPTCSDTQVVKFERANGNALEPQDVDIESAQNSTNMTFATLLKDQRVTMVTGSGSIVSD